MDNEKIDLIKSSRQYVIRLSNGIKTEIEGYRLGNIKDISNILLITEGISFILKALSLTTDIKKNNDELYNKVSEYLQNLTDAVENNDTVSITDVLEYEFLPLLDECLQIFNDLITA